MRKNKKWIVIIVCVLLVVGMALAAFDTRLKVVTYEVKDSRITAPVRIGLVTDLHSCDYGENQEDLTKRIAESDPDVLLLGGDIIDDVLEPAKAMEFLNWAGENYPTYYVSGNHEYWSGRIEEFKQMVTDAGIPVLEGEKVPLNINGQSLDLFGIDDPEDVTWGSQLDAVTSELNPEVYSILLTHRPERIDLYVERNFDLALAGHAHGGQWRIPFLLNGVFSPDQGLFPKYAGGLYEEGDTSMIVSRGLSRESTRVPRIFNRPEYVVVELRGEE